MEPGCTVSADTRPCGSAARGRLRIYLGYAPGAGATCALLSEGRRRAEGGTDVVVASAETHGRPHTEELLAGLEVIPAAKVPYRALWKRRWTSARRWPAAPRWRW